MKVQVFVVGNLATNCYVASCSETKAAIVIDPGFTSIREAQNILNHVENDQLSVKLVVNTHGHEDHICGNIFFKKKYGIPIYVHKYDAPLTAGSVDEALPANVYLNEGDAIEFGEIKLRVMHSPGHSLGSICLLSEKLIFTGDTLFAGGIGRTDFLDGSMSDMKMSLERLLLLPERLVVYPGHGPATTIGEEKRCNPFLRWL